MASTVAPPPPPPLPCASLYVGDLDPFVSEFDLYQALSALSVPIASIHLCRDSASGKSLRYAYVNFFSRPDASKVLDSLNHKNLNGKPMRIMWCQKNSLPRKTGVGNLFVKNLNPSVDSAVLENIFCKFGAVVSCKVAEENGKSKGFGFVQFESENSSMDALSALHDTMLHGKKLYVSKFVKKSERQAVSGEPKFTNLYVKNLDQDLTEDTLQAKFSEFGKVCSVAIMKDGEGKSRGFGFVSFELPEEAKKAVEAMNVTQLGSKHIIVGRAQKKTEREQLLKCQFEQAQKRWIEKMKASNVFVKNIDRSVDDNKLKEHFSMCGWIISAKVMRHDDGMSKGFGFVCFSTPDEAKKAIATFNGTRFFERSLYVAMAQFKEDRSAAFRIQHAQYPLGAEYSSACKVFPPVMNPPYYHFPASNTGSLINPHQPIMYQSFGVNKGACHPPDRLGYRESVSMDILRLLPQGQMSDWAAFDPYYHHNVHQINTLQGIQQHLMKYSKTKHLLQELNRKTPESDKPSSKKMANKNSFPAEEVLSEISGGIKRMIAETAPGKRKEAIGELLYPVIQKFQFELAGKITGMLLEMDDSDLLKLLESPELLASQIEKAVLVLKQANALPVESSQCITC